MDLKEVTNTPAEIKAVTTQTQYETKRVTVTNYVTVTTTQTPEDVRIFTRYVYVFIFILIIAPMAVWRLGRSGKRAQAAAPPRQIRLCPRCGRGLTDFPSKIHICPYCGVDLK
jgi:hypothetical protein